jgi:4-amino-4-deoxy-L-arabinose transferase-like glycosyltransferase
MPGGAGVKWPRGTLSLVLLLVLLVGTVLRVEWNDVSRYSSGDELIYRDYTRFLVTNGWSAYPILVAVYLATPAIWISPPPLRYGYFGILTAACRAAGQCEQRTVAWVATLAGILMIPLAYAIGLHFFDQPTGLLAAALVATSPLQLALGRRALQDEPSALFAVAAVAAILWARDDAPRPWLTLLRTTAALVLSAFALAVKESFLLFYPALLAAYALGIRTRGFRRRDLVLFLAPPLVYFAGFVLTSQSVWDFFTIARRLVGSLEGNTYVLENEGGPPHRPLFDFFVLSPTVCVLATAALAFVVARPGEAPPGPKRFSILLVGLFVVYGFVSKNLRFFAGADTLLRLLAAWALWAHLVPRRWRVPGTILVVLLSGLSELLLFHRVFIRGAVYDPVAVELLRTLGVLPPQWPR